MLNSRSIQGLLFVCIFSHASLHHSTIVIIHYFSEKKLLLLMAEPSLPERFNYVMNYLFTSFSPQRSTDIYYNLEAKGIRIEVMSVLEDIKRLNLVEITQHPLATMNKSMYMLKPSVRAEILGLPETDRRNLYGYYHKQTKIPFISSPPKPTNEARLSTNEVRAKQTSLPTLETVPPEKPGTQLSERTFVKFKKWWKSFTTHPSWTFWGVVVTMIGIIVAILLVTSPNTFSCNRIKNTISKKSPETQQIKRK